MKTPTFLALTLLAVSLHAEPPKRAVVAQTPDGQPVEVFTLTNAHGLRARVITWGATLIELSVPDRAGKLADVTLGFDDPARYLEPHPGFGNVVGRFANRIAGGKFTLEGKVIEVTKNSGANHIHGGRRGFGQRNWKVERATENTLSLNYTAEDGEEGYPGRFEVTVTYALNSVNVLRIGYQARVFGQPTVVNLTNHTYWNLAGAGDVLGHELHLDASRYTVVDEALIPTGEIRPVAGTPLDFTKLKLIGRDIAALKGEKSPQGYDHNYVLDSLPSVPDNHVAELYDPASGRAMHILTTEPGVQLYTANHLNKVGGKTGTTYGPHAGVCFETQHFPDSPNHPNFPTTVLRPGETFRSTTLFKFWAK